MRNVYDIIDVDKEELPVSFDVVLGVETFILGFDYNDTGDFFTVDLYKSDEEGNEVPIVLGEKMSLGAPLWKDLVMKELPAPTLIPLDLGGQERRISFDNFGETVFLYVDDGPPEEADADE